MDPSRAFHKTTPTKGGEERNDGRRVIRDGRSNAVGIEVEAPALPISSDPRRRYALEEDCSPVGEKSTTTAGSTKSKSKSPVRVVKKDGEKEKVKAKSPVRGIKEGEKEKAKKEVKATEKDKAKKETSKEKVIKKDPPQPVPTDLLETIRENGTDIMFINLRAVIRPFQATPAYKEDKWPVGADNNAIEKYYIDRRGDGHEKFKAFCKGRANYDSKN
jgi:hypothetical protein